MRIKSILDRYSGVVDGILMFMKVILKQKVNSAANQKQHFYQNKANVNVRRDVRCETPHELCSHETEITIKNCVKHVMVACSS